MARDVIADFPGMLSAVDIARIRSLGRRVWLILRGQPKCSRDMKPVKGQVSFTCHAGQGAKQHHHGRGLEETSDGA